MRLINVVDEGAKPGSVMEKISTDTPLTADAKTAFVLGNGPSLAGVSLAALNEYGAIGMNAAYRYWRKIDWRPRYYACCDLVVGLSHRDEIAALIREGRIQKFLLRANLIEALGTEAARGNILNFDALRLTDPFLRVDPPTTGSHAALWAGSMGYSKVVMLGIDGRYQEFVDGADRKEGIELEIVRAGENPNYFFPDYQQPGDRYNIPNPRPGLHLEAWRKAGARLETHGVTVLNANHNSAVECFPFIDLDKFLSAGALPSARREELPQDTDDAAENQTMEAMSARQKLTEFFKASHKPLLLAGAAVAALFVLWSVLANPAPSVMLFGAILAASVFGIGVIGLYVRYAILRHLNQQDAMLVSLRARTMDLERRLSAD